MTMTDPIADFLTRIRNATRAQHKTVEIPASRILVSMAGVLKEEGYIEAYEVIENPVQNILSISLKYTSKNKSVISDLSRISTPGRRHYTGIKEIPRVMGGLGIAIMSTPKGILTDRQARYAHVGGEVLCYVW